MVFLDKGLLMGDPFLFFSSSPKRWGNGGVTHADKKIATSEEIRNGLKEPPHLRTIQRLLSALLVGQQITAEGKGKATIYKLLTHTTPGEYLRQSNSSRIEESYEAYIPLSEPGREIYSYVNRPRAGRNPVGYERDLLDAYAPNETWYLGEMTCKHLRQIGDAGVLERPAGTYGRAILSRLLIDLSWASSRLEGNTYSRLDTENFIQYGNYANGKDSLEAQMILNHKLNV